MATSESSPRSQRRVRRFPFFWVGIFLSAVVAGAVAAYLLLSGPLTIGRGARAEDSSLVGSYLSAHLAVQNKDDVSAARFFRAALERDPKNPLLLERAFATSLAAGEMEPALALARRIVAQNENHELAQLALMTESVKAGDFAAARSAFKIVRASFNGPNFLISLLDAWLAAGEGRIEEAAAALRPLEDIEQIKSYADLHRALIYVQAGRRDEAKRYVEKAAEAASRLPFRSVQHIVAYHAAQGDKAKALAVLETYIEAHQDSEGADFLRRRLEADQEIEIPVSGPADGVAESYYALASLMQSREATQQSLIQAQLAVYLRPDDGAGLALLANILQARDQTDLAIEYYLKVDDRSPFGWEARLSAAQLHAIAERYDAAAELFREMADEQEDRWDALYLLGGVRRSQEDYAAAIEAYEEAIARVKSHGGEDTRHWQIYFALGIAHHQADQWPQAEAAFLRSLELLPEQPEVMNYLAYSWVERREHLDRALEMLQRAVAARPRNAAIIDSVGWAHYQLGHYEEAIGYLERAVALAPGEPEINDHLGDAYWRVGRRHEARFQWRRTLSLNPPEEWVPRIRRKIEVGLEAGDKTGGAAGDGEQE